MEDSGMDELARRRREFLLGLGKWSMVVVGVAVVAGELLHSVAEAGWLNNRGGGGGWINRRGGGGWLNAR